ncbi:carbon-nitrogen hydrolase family protein [Cupriavidus taiwanensis]|uniref:Putative Nitrilase/N-carbamoyl-D-aminoacid amidohydrolase n=1 Tax=Cupriavidus taiwanensis TaxID=164546 RepID=A0A7Z7JA18_9BURK|nr:carbon-nitrogen hydrolase family protein [Cupriavidus taiwanensis]SOY57996.1 putative Nitrilase/N-carbamoyl-D-aminoacid amidohydrolase [Cupriavidus taiwanensis]SOY85978.1 putative Nitrilase/N-carbamoyl-D-aminoacid amidohydrolase [Cupriavidus taiwanensis]SOZ02034.1 putative Nitrilase/N-carbamoyl-D-aminoacid amidohydrolase [Cupriavidus taiwanensis]SOZ05022.1 putative Nitrilase/N-carbamoyl-D-aminoacid amidohydrolase [Cupriavidus taiwanensis]SPC09504.1 putative Nitrilase/N-carbamoyl-D-aminoacid
MTPTSSASPAPFRVAAVQTVTGTSLDANLARAEARIAEAAAGGAELVLLPEYFCIMGRAESDKVAVREHDGDGPVQQFLADTARRHGIWLVGGTLPMWCDDPQRVYNTSLAFNPRGERIARYDKIHLFGFTRGTESYDESRTILAGRTPVSFDAPCGRVAMSVCYDLRFPELYRGLAADGGTSLILMPAAFTYTTGQAHWEILLRARAIENQCYVLAAAQGGKHENGRRTWGHSMLVDPWGEVLAMLPEGEGVVGGVIDPARLEEVRQNLPALRHRVL